METPHQNKLTSTNKQLAFTSLAWEDYQYWLEHNKALLKKTNTLIKSILRTPEEGIGKPEKLKYLGENIWSRRINSEHRIVYAVDNDTITIIQCRYHYV